MKKILLYGLIKQLSRSGDPYQMKKLKKKLAIFAAFAFFAVIFLGGVAVWGAVTLLDRLATGVQTNQAKSLVDKGQEQLHKLGSQPLVTQKCLDTVTGLAFSSTQWLTVPLAQNINSITTSCLGGKRQQ